MPVAAGDVLLITKNSRYTKNGDLRRVKSCNEHEIVLDNGRKLDPVNSAARPPGTHGHLSG